MPNLEVVEVAVVQCYLVDQYQQKFEVLHTFENL